MPPAHPVGPGKRAVKRLWCGGGDDLDLINIFLIYCMVDNIYFSSGGLGVLHHFFIFETLQLQKP